MRNLDRFALVGLLFLAAVLGPAPGLQAAAAPPSFTAVEVTPPAGGANASGWWLNEQGQVAGTYSVAGMSYSFIWDRVHGAQDLGNLGAGTSIGGQCLNNQGKVAGIFTYNGQAGYHGFLWDPKKLPIKELGACAGDNYSFPAQINNRGQISGWSYGGPSPDKACLWDPAQGLQAQALQLLARGGSSYPLCINNGGGPNDFFHQPHPPFVISGAATNSDGDWHAVVWNSTGSIKDLGTLGGRRSQANGVNDQGWVVGMSEVGSNTQSPANDNSLPGAAPGIFPQAGAPEGAPLAILRPLMAGGYQQENSSPNLKTPGPANFHAFLWRGGKLQDLGVLPQGTWSRADMINKYGMVVGEADTNGITQAFYWTAKDGMISLNLPGPASIFSTLVNNYGQVTGVYADGQGHNRAFYWTKTLGVLDLTALVSGLPGGVSLTFGFINDRGMVLARGSNNKSYLLVPQKLQKSLGGVHLPWHLLW